MCLHPQVKVPMKFNGRSGVQLRAPRDLADLAAYTALKFYLQSPVAVPTPGENTGDHFVLYMGSREVPGVPEGGLGWVAGWKRLVPVPTVSSCCCLGHWGLPWCVSAQPKGALGVPAGGGQPCIPQH